jgi:FMN-dependent NADH-azoreductase
MDIQPGSPEWLQQAKTNAQALESEIGSLQRHMSEKHYREFWALTKAISEMFKKLKPLRAEDRERLWSIFSTVCEEIKAKQEEGRSRSRQLADSILAKVEQAQPSDFILSPDDLRETLKDLGNHLRQAGEMLSRHKHEMLGEHKQECFNRIQEMRATHQVYWDRVKSSQDQRQSRSRQLANDILSEIEGSRPCDLFGFMPPDVEEMKCLGRKLRDAGQRLSSHKREMFGEHKQECFDRIQEMRKVHDAWWEMLTQHRSQSFEDRQSRIRANIDQNYERHRKAAAALESCRTHADELRNQIASAWNDDWRSRAEGWLAELEDKIRDIESSLERIEEWIREGESRLR